MKILLRPLLLSLLLALPATHAAAPGNPARVVLTFQDPGKFTDIEINGFTDDSARGVIFDQLNAHLAALARRHLAEGQTLTITMTDVDLAGAVEPWRGPQFQTLRIVRETYPPRLRFTYQLTGPDGTVLKEGKENLTDLAFMFHARPFNEDITRYEKELLTDWMRTAFGKAVASK